MGFSCCVINCKNTTKNSKCKFYSFPIASWKKEQRKKWITAVRRKNFDGSLWLPSTYDRICSDHFVDGEKSEEELSPSYVPTIFPKIYKTSNVNESAALKRHKRYMARRMMNQKTSSTSNNNNRLRTSENMEMKVDNPIDQSFPVKKQVDQECQVDIFSDSNEIEKTFICNRYITTTKCDAEIQTSIKTVGNKIIGTQKIFKNKLCGTSEKKLVDASTETDDKSFIGIKSIHKDEQLVDLAGVTFSNYQFLLKRISTLGKCTISKDDRLLIFLMKMKTGITFSALSVLFGVHRTTISRIFYSVLHHLASATDNLVFWPKIETVKATMPNCFHPDYSNTRVIIDCTEFKIEIPADVDNRVYCYSHYKKTFTAKVLIGITPGGFICFKSKVAGGRKTDSQLTVESGLLDKLEDGDVVLADKGFPEIKTTIDQSGKKIILVMPPFLEQNQAFSKQETEETYKVARVRIHVERIIQRLRLYMVLNKITENLFHCIDDILHICCVLVNLQPPIISNIMNK